MIPVNNGNTLPCSPVSSNCVIWQGPDIACINLCNGDTVSDVVAKLATELCDIINQTCVCNPDISGLTLDCLPPDTTLELEPVLQAIIDYICNLNPGSNVLPNINLNCLEYDDPSTGNPVTVLPLDQFAQLLGNKVCDILTEINTIKLDIIDLQDRIVVLENCVLPCVSPGSVTPTIEVISSCLYPGVTVSLSDLVLELESQFCTFRNAVGSVTLINSAISAQCLTALDTRLSGPGTYGSVTGWVTSPSTLAESNVDQWLVICDLYEAVKGIKETCCDTGCSGVIFGVSYIPLDSNSDGVVDNLLLNFTSSTIPVGFSDCGGATIVTITDINGVSITQSINVTTLSTDPAGVTISLSGLNTLAPLVLSVPFCVTDGTSTCSERDNIAIPLNIPCPSDLNATALVTDITVTFTNNLGTGVTYTITAIDSSTGLPLGTTNITSPGIPISHTFSGAVPGRSYSIILTISQGASVKTCPPVTVLVPGTEEDLGSIWYSGNYVPTTTGLPAGQAENDFFLHTGTGDVYKRLASSWSLEMNIKGPAGPSDIEIAHSYNANATIAIVGVPVPITWGSTLDFYTTDGPALYFEVNPLTGTGVKINTAGRYEISFDINISNAAGATREYTIDLTKNGSSSFLPRGAARTSNSINVTAATTGWIDRVGYYGDLASGDIIDIEITNFTDTTDPNDLDVYMKVRKVSF